MNLTLSYVPHNESYFVLDVPHSESYFVLQVVSVFLEAFDEAGKHLLHNEIKPVCTFSACTALDKATVIF